MTNRHSHHMSAPQRHRAAGVLLGMAAGDALGAGYEFGPPLPDDYDVEMVGGGAFGWEPGEWTDDTSMALVIAQAAAEGDLASVTLMDRVAAGFVAWSKQSKDVGVQTSAVLHAGSRHGKATGQSLAEAAAEHFRQHGKGGGNGSLMRTAPVALAFLHDEDGLAATARTVSDLTHADPEAGDACVLWCLAIRHAVLTGELDLRRGLTRLPSQRREAWATHIDAAEVRKPSDFTHNGWVVEALQAAWCAISTSPGPGAEQLRLALEAAVRGGRDTDTVAAIAGGLLGAVHGAAAVPAQWRRVLHGWPGLRARDLIALGVQVSERDSLGPRDWPLVRVFDYSEWGDLSALAEHPRDPGVLLGGVGALHRLPEGVDAVVSLCRLGADEAPATGVAPESHVEVWLVDSDDPADNPDLTFVLADTVEVLRQLRAEGHTVLVHCVQAQSRTPTVAALYSVAAFGVAPDEALAEVCAVLRGAAPNQKLRAAIQE